jgi:hypothetical protein
MHIILLSYIFLLKHSVEISCVECYEDHIVPLSKIQVKDKSTSMGSRSLGIGKTFVLYSFHPSLQR